MILLQASDTVIAAYLSALNSNVGNLCKLFPLAAFELGTDEPPPILLVTCPTTLKPNIKSQIDTDVRALTVGTCTLPFRPSPTDKSHQPSGALPAAVQQLQQKLQGQVMQVEYRAATAEVVITAFQNVLPSVQRVAYACLGLGAQPNAPQVTPTQPASREQQVVSLLQVSDYVSQMKS